MTSDAVLQLHKTRVTELLFENQDLQTQVEELIATNKHLCHTIDRLVAELNKADEEAVRAKADLAVFQAEMEYLIWTPPAGEA